MRKTAAKTQPRGAMGVHHVLELYGCPPVALNDPALLSRVIADAAALSNTKLLDSFVHLFPGHGAALGLLAESHIAVHTWPEHGYAAVDLFACGEGARPEAGCAYVIEALQARRHTLCTIRRGEALDSWCAGTSLGEQLARNARKPICEGAFGHDLVNAGFQVDK